MHTCIYPHLNFLFFGCKLTTTTKETRKIFIRTKFSLLVVDDRNNWISLSMYLCYTYTFSIIAVFGVTIKKKSCTYMYYRLSSNNLGNLKQFEFVFLSSDFHFFSHSMWILRDARDVWKTTTPAYNKDDDGDDGK